MKKTTAIRTIDEKAAFIAENMELTFDRVLNDFDIKWEYEIECKCYAVEDATNCETIYVDYDEAYAAYNDLVDELEDPLYKNAGVLIGAKVTIIEVDIRHYDFIKSSDLDAATLSDLFDNLSVPIKVIAEAEVTSDGIVER